MNHITKVLSFLISLCINLYSQSNNYLDSLLQYYPLQIGNKWVFSELYMTTIEPFEGINRKWGREVIKDTIMPNDKVYKKIVRITYDTPKYISVSYERIDSSRLKVFKYDSSADTTDLEKLILDFSKNPGDTLLTPYWMIVFENENEVNYFEQTFRARHYSHTHGMMGYGDYYLKDIGLYKYTWAADFVYSSSELKGCVVNNVIYGDTTITSVAQESDVTPQSFQLFQNYPNPFNPSTTIEYTIHTPTYGVPSREGNQRGVFVTLKIYDILGREVATLVNEHQQPGKYKVKFDVGANRRFALQSGVYFYTLRISDSSLRLEFNETKKMILAK